MQNLATLDVSGAVNPPVNESCTLKNTDHFHALSLLKIVKLETKFLFSCHVDISHVMCSLVRLADSLDSIRGLPVKAYPSRFPILIFKYLGFDCQVKLIFFT